MTFRIFWHNILNKHKNTKLYIDLRIGIILYET